MFWRHMFFHKWSTILQHKCVLETTISSTMWKNNMKINWLNILFMCIITCNCCPIIVPSQIYITHVWSIGFGETDEYSFWLWWLWCDATSSSFPDHHPKIRGFMINYIYRINSNLTSNSVMSLNFTRKYSWCCKEEGKVERNYNNCFMFFPNLYVIEFSSI